MLLTEITGSESFVHLKCDGANWVAVMPGVVEYAPGDRLDAEIDPANLYIFDLVRAAGRRAGDDVRDAMARIDLVDLAHSYQGPAADAASYALKPMSMTWRQGGAYALLGPSGCGKTTLLNIISGLVQPSRGKILFDGKDVTPLSTQRRNIAQVFQFPVIYDTMTVAENLAFPLKNRGMPRDKIAARVAEIAQLLDLTPYLDRKATRLTADAKQKISLGRGLVRPDVAAILFDEPLTVIDPHLKWELRSKLKALHRALDLTMIYVTHDQTEALTFADTVVVMQDGLVVQSGTPQELFEKPAHTFVGYFIGSPGMNILPAAVQGRRAHLSGPPDRAAAQLRQASARREDRDRRAPGIRDGRGSRGRPAERACRADRRSRAHALCTRARRRAAARGACSRTALRIAGSDVGLDFDPAHVHVYADSRLVEGAA